MIVRAATSGDNAVMERLISEAPAEFSYAAKLRAAGKMIPELSLISAGDNGEVTGYIGFCRAVVPDMECVFMAGVYAPDDDTRKLLIRQAGDKARELGIDGILAYTDKVELFVELGYASSIYYGVLLPDDPARLGYMLYQPITDKKSQELAYAALPGELEMEAPADNLAINTRMSGEEYEKAAMNTRRRSRIIESTVILLIIVLCIVLLIIRKSLVYLGPCAVLCYLLYSHVIGSNKFLKKNIEGRNESSSAGLNEYFLFCNDFFITYSPGGSCNCESYAKFHFLYLKKDYLFFGYPVNKGANLYGHYIMYRDIPDKTAFVEFLKKRSGGIRVMK